MLYILKNCCSLIWNFISMLQSNSSLCVDKSDLDNLCYDFFSDLRSDILLISYLKHVEIVNIGSQRTCLCICDG